MKTPSIVLVSIAAIIAGCSSPSKVVTADIQFRCGTNVVTVSQPKDTVIGSLEFDPRTGKLVLRDYSSTANAAAIKAVEAQAAAQALVATGAMDTIRLLIERGAAGYAAANGIPMGTSRDSTNAKAPAVAGARVEPTSGVSILPR